MFFVLLLLLCWVTGVLLCFAHVAVVKLLTGSDESGCFCFTDMTLRSGWISGESGEVINV